ncbi:RnfABCDGE type electron transport complex subunit B [Dokdonella sp. MW10]|uniref:RnfABCDGE type electron transport complex subunit B n=1 Tax=Dokdonella sp. MW10 TaxID=2992926 RepID=UPI003F815B3E
MADRATLIDALLPQTQCTRCGFPACRPYAEAIDRGEADIDRCPPGGEEGVVALATLLGRAAKPLDPAYGLEAPPTVAVIDEAVCIGCTKCIQACPVDAIVGAARRMHTIVADECTGCELCIAPCPVDCIAMVPVAVAPLPRNRVLARAAHARKRYEARRGRLDTGDDDSLQRIADKAPDVVAQPVATPISRNAVLEAIARGRARRQQGPST